MRTQNSIKNIVIGFFALILAATGCATQTFNLSQSKTGPQTTCYGSFGKQCRATYSGVKMEDGTIGYAIWTDKEFEEITAIDAKTKELILRNWASKEAFFQHTKLKPGESRRLLFTVVIDGVITDTIETWEAILVGDQLLDLDTYLASTTTPQAPSAAPVQAPAPAASAPQAAPAPQQAPAPPATVTLTVTAEDAARLQALLAQPAANQAPTTGATTVAAGTPPAPEATAAAANGSTAVVAAQ